MRALRSGAVLGLTATLALVATAALAEPPAAAPAPAPAPAPLPPAPPPPAGAATPAPATPAPAAAAPAPATPATAAAAPAPASSAPAPAAAPPAAAAAAAPAPAPAAAPAPAPAAPATQPPPPNAVPPAASGFQISFRTGLMFPFGDATNAPSDTLSRRYAWQIPLVIDLGGRFAQSFFLGAYLGFGVGTTGSDVRVDAACTDDDDNGQNDIACSAASARIGLEMQYAFAPDQHFNPWVGYGIGFESATASITDRYRSTEETVSSNGVTFAQLSAGFDLRGKVGFGPFLEVALGQFNSTTTDLGSRGKFKYTIEDRALHAWLMLGVRLVVNP